MTYANLPAVVCAQIGGIGEFLMEGRKGASHSTKRRGEPCSGQDSDFLRESVGGGEEGIRTLDTLLTYTPLAGERLRPLGHLSGAA